MTTKLKYKDEWLDPDEVLARKRADSKPPAAPAPPVDVAALPERAALDPDMPLEQLWFEHPEIRACITKDGQVRSGLTKEQQAVGEELLRKYGGKA